MTKEFFLAKLADPIQRRDGAIGEPKKNHTVEFRELLIYHACPIDTFEITRMRLLATRTGISSRIFGRPFCNTPEHAFLTTMPT